MDNVVEDVQTDMYLLYLNIDHAENLSTPTNINNNKGKISWTQEKKASMGLEYASAIRTILFSKQNKIVLFDQSNTCALIKELKTQKYTTTESKQ